MQLGHQPQRLGISFEVIEILPHLGRKKLAHRHSLKLQPGQVVPEPLADSRFTKMAEGGIANVVKQPGALENIADIGLKGGLKSLITYGPQNLFRNILPQGFAKGGYLQRMGQSGTNKVAFIQRKDLCFVLQPSEGSAVDNAVIIFFKLCSKIARSRRASIAADRSPDTRGPFCWLP